MSVETARDLFIHELKDIYSAEKQAVRAYPKLAKAADSDELRDCMHSHLEQTKQHVERLDQVFEKLDARPGSKTCEGMRALIEEANQLAQEIESGPVLDAALIGALQRIEHYEIAAYGTAAALAGELGEDEVQELLGHTLQEEKETDQKLTDIAGEINTSALSAGEEESSEEMDEEASPAHRSRSRKAA